MTTDFETIFARLRSILEKHAGALTVAEDTATRYCLEGAVGPATLQAWRGKMKRPTMPVAWVQAGKAYVSFHHMALYGSSSLRDGLSPELSRRMQGKSCFNFRVADEALFSELEQVTARGFEGMKRAGFVR